MSKPKNEQLFAESFHVLFSHVQLKQFSYRVEFNHEWNFPGLGVMEMKIDDCQPEISASYEFVKSHARWASRWKDLIMKNNQVKSLSDDDE